MSIKYKHIYFDLDGTIIDSSEGVVNSMLNMLKAFSIDNYSIDEIKRVIIGPPLYEGLKNLTDIQDDKILNKMIKIFRDDYKEFGVYQNNLFPDIKKILVELYNLDCKMYILTSKPEKFAKEIIKQHKIEKYFQKIDGAGENDVKSLKADKLELATKYTKPISIMIGDRVEDIMAGKSSGVDTIGVTYGFDDINLLKQARPTYQIDNVMDILRVIKG